MSGWLWWQYTYWCARTWFLADPVVTTAGRTDRGGTGNKVINIQSGRANLGLIPSTTISSSAMLKFDYEKEVSIYICIYIYLVLLISLPNKNEGQRYLPNKLSSVVTCDYAQEPSLKTTTIIISKVQGHNGCQAKHFVMGIDHFLRWQCNSQQLRTHHCMHITYQC